MGLFDDAGINPEDLDTGLRDGPHKAVLSEVTTDYIRTGNKEDPEETRLNQVYVYTLEDFDFELKKFFPLLEDGVTTKDLDDTDDSFNVYAVAGPKKEVRQTELQWWKNQYAQHLKWLIAHGVPEDKVNTVSPKDLINTEGILTTKQNSRGFANPVAFTVPGASGRRLPKKPATPSVPKPVPSTTQPVANATPAANPFTA